MPKEAQKPRQVEPKLVGAEAKAAKPAFPKAPADQIAALCTLLSAQRASMRASGLARKFAQGKPTESRVADVLEILADQPQDRKQHARVCGQVRAMRRSSRLPIAATVRR